MTDPVARIVHRIKCVPFPIKIHLLPPTLPGRQATSRAPVVKKDAALGVPVREVGGMDGGGRREGLVTGDLLVVGVILVGSFTGGTRQAAEGQAGLRRGA